MDANQLKALMEKWAPVLDTTDAPAIVGQEKRIATAVMLENTEKDAQATQQVLAEDATNNTSGIADHTPVLISMIRRAAPQLLPFDLMGVQPLAQPSGLIFAMRSRYTDKNGPEALFNEADSDFSGAATPQQAGTNPAVLADSTPGSYTAGTGLEKSIGETLGGSGPAFGTMALTVEKVTATAVTRALKTGYTAEFAQDLKSLHGLDADSEMSRMLSSEIIAETNRECVRTLYRAAKIGAQDATVAGTFDLDQDANGRWLAERHKGLMFQIMRESNAVAQQTRLGNATFVLASADVVAALAMIGQLDYSQAGASLTVDQANVTFAGTLKNGLKVYVDPFSGVSAGNEQFAMVGYKGQSPFAAGYFYSPYVPLTMVRTIDPTTMTPIMAYRTRYALTAHPFFGASNNPCYRLFRVRNVQ
jgi:hypothetical protein